jgi:hypothetical protein
MTPEEVARVLAAAAARDNRKVGTVDVLAWLQDIGDLNPDDALAAVSEHYRESTDRIMPAHVRRLALAAEKERRRAARELFESQALRELESDPTRYNRTPALEALLADLRERLPKGDPDKLRRAEWLEVDRRREREATAEPNPLYAGPPPVGGHPIPEEQQ